MPLVVPGLVPGKAGAASSTGTDMKQFWMNQLLGKKLTDGESDETSFARKDLPKEHRVFAHHEKKPSDSARDRLDIFLAEDGTIMNVDLDKEQQ